MISWDHVLPRAHHKGVHDNLRPSCRPCNKNKANFTVEEFRARMLAWSKNPNKFARISFWNSPKVERLWQFDEGTLRFYFEVNPELRSEAAINQGYPRSMIVGLKQVSRWLVRWPEKPPTIKENENGR
jgi:hypothetical protein